MLYVNKLIILFLSVFILITSSVNSIYADHLEPGEGIFREDGQANIIKNEDGEYQIYLQITIRNENGQLINVTENTATGSYIDHEVTTNAFNKLMGEKKIIVIDNIKYEKVQWKFSPSLEHRVIGLYPVYSEIAIEFESESDKTKRIHTEQKDYAIWKMHYCGDFSRIGHDFECIPLFQVLVPTMTLEPDDTVTLQWTVLRELD